MRSLLFLQSLFWTMSDAMRSLHEDIDRRALQWAVATDDDDIETFLEGTQIEGIDYETFRPSQGSPRSA